MVHYFFSFTAYKAVSGGSCLQCETAKGISGSTQIVSPEQQKVAHNTYCQFVPKIFQIKKKMSKISMVKEVIKWTKTQANWLLGKSVEELHDDGQE